MKKIPTLFERDPAKRYQVVPRLTLNCEWVLRGDGFTTIKLDGVNVKVEAGGRLLRRLRPATGASEAAYVPFLEEDSDYPQVKEAYANAVKTSYTNSLREGIYEVYGPKIEGNHQQVTEHMMIRIAPVDSQLMISTLTAGIKRGVGVAVETFFDSVKACLIDSPDIEGIVFHQESGGVPIAMAKIKRKDFGLAWPVQAGTKEGTDAGVGGAIVPVVAEVVGV